MAVPKGKTSKSKTKSRYANAYKATAPGLAECPHCHEMKKNHYACAKCGHYDGVQKIEIEKADKKSK